MRKFLIYFIVFTFFFVSPTPAKATDLPNPGPGWTFTYTKSSNSILQKPSTTAGSAVIQKNFIYSNPEKLSGGLLKELIPVLGGRLKVEISRFTYEQGLLAFMSNDFNNVYLIVKPGYINSESQALGLFWKEGTADKYFFHLLEIDNTPINNLNPSNMKLQHTSPAQVTSTIANADDTLKLLVMSTNGNGLSTTSSGLTGMAGIVNNLLEPDRISGGLELCGKATLDFSQSEYWQYLSDEDKLKTPQGSTTWPDDFLVAGARTATSMAVPIYVQQVFSENVYLTINTPAMPRGYSTIDMKPEGTWKINMDGLPVGKYKLISEFFLRKDNNNIARPDVPTEGSFRDYVANILKIPDNIEVFTNDKLEVEITKDASGKFVANSQALTDCSYSLDLKPKSFWDAGRLNATADSECDEISEGSSFMLLVKKGICAMLEVMKDWADGFMRWAIGWMKASMGVSDSNKDMETPDLEPDTGKVPMGGSSGNSSGGGTGGTTGTSTPSTPITLSNAGTVKIPSAEVAKIKTEAEKSSGIISARIFKTNGAGKVDKSSGMAAQIKIVSPGQTQTAVEVKAQNALSYTNSVLMFSADGQNYKITLLKTGTDIKFSPANITKMSGAIPELPGSESDSGTDSESEAGTAAPMNITGKIIFNNSREFVNAVDFEPEIEYKVKNSNGKGGIISVTDSCFWTDYKDTSGRGYAKCTFTTKEKIPADWKTITLYGVRNGEVLVRIMMQYPPDPPSFVISNTFAN